MHAKHTISDTVELKEENAFIKLCWWSLERREEEKRGDDKKVGGDRQSWLL